MAEEKSSINGMDWIYGIWYVSNNKGDWMGTLGKRDGKWIWEYRFRYYKDDKAFDSEDEKSWYKMSADNDSQANLERILQVVKDLTPILETRYGDKIDFVDLQCTAEDPKFMFELGSRPWAHIKAGSDAVPTDLNVGAKHEK